jgi:hypothetical protein
MFDKKDAEQNSNAAADVEEKFKKLVEEKRRAYEKQKRDREQRRRRRTAKQTPPIDFDEEEIRDDLVNSDNQDTPAFNDSQNDNSQEYVNNVGTNHSTAKVPKSEANTWPPYTKLPTPLTRISPFYIMSKKQMKDRPDEEVTVENNWGKMTFEGERLSVYDETTLLFLLKTAKRKKFKTIYTTRYELCKLFGKSPHRDTYNAIWDSVKRLSETHLTIQSKDKHKQLHTEISGTLISCHFRIKPRGEQRAWIDINPYFEQIDSEGRVTSLSMKLRSRLKGDTAKALYRFYNGQQPFYSGKGEYGCSLRTLCKAINQQYESVPLWKLRDRIKTGIGELKKHGYLRGQIMHNDYVKVENLKTDRFMD